MAEGAKAAAKATRVPTAAAAFMLRRFMIRAPFLLRLCTRRFNLCGDLYDNRMTPNRCAGAGISMRGFTRLERAERAIVKQSRVRRLVSPVKPVKVGDGDTVGHPRADVLGEAFDLAAV
ncbi:MAG: hypothetical protein WAK01_18050 [Methylocystis sp.]